MAFKDEKTAMNRKPERGSNLIFVVSQPRSGSTLLQRMLGAHPDCMTTAEPWGLLHPLYALRETGYSAEYDAKFAKEGLEGLLSVFEDGEAVYLEEVRRMWISLYRRAGETKDRQKFIDKTPRYYLILPELVKVFPDAAVVILLRNPLAVLVSVLDTWVKGNWEILSRDAMRMDLFEGPMYLHKALETLPNLLRLKYEEIVEEPALHLQRLCEKAGMPFDAGMVEYGLAEKPKGSLGDPLLVDLENAPKASRKDRWKERVRTSPVVAGLARHYFQQLDPDLLTSWGYPPEELEAVIASGERWWSAWVPWSLLMRRPSSPVGKLIKPILETAASFVEARSGSASPSPSGGRQ